MFVFSISSSDYLFFLLDWEFISIFFHFAINLELSQQGLSWLSRHGKVVDYSNFKQVFIYCQSQLATKWNILFYFVFVLDDITAFTDVGVVFDDVYIAYDDDDVTWILMMMLLLLSLLLDFSCLT